MKYLPSTLLFGALALVLHAQTPQPQSAPNAKPPGDPFVKNVGDDPGHGDGEEKPVPDVMVVFETYAMSMEEAAALLGAEGGSAARYRRVLDLAKGGKARLQTLAALTTKTGQRAVVEAIDEVRFAAEFEGGETAKDAPAPTAWNTRNAGDTLEFEPVLSPDQKVCDLNLLPLRVTLAGFREVPGMTNDWPSTQPEFQTQKITTSVTAIVGEPFYLGTFSSPPPQAPAGGNGAKETCLAFLHVQPQHALAMDKKAAPKADELEQVNLQYICYSLDRATAREILATPGAITAPWEKVQALAAEKKAKLEFISSVKTKSGQRMVAEETQEVHFVGEYRGPSVARWQQTGTITEQDGKVSSVRIDQLPIGQERLPGYATAFEIRNTGITVEVEPVIRADYNLDVNQVIQNVQYVGTLKVSGMASRHPPQPLFQSSKVTTGMTLTTGQHTLVGTLNPPGADGVNDRVDTGRTWLLFAEAAISDR